jgi:hypothetical protein
MFPRIIVFFGIAWFALTGILCNYAVMCLWAANGGIKLPFMGEILSLIMKFVAIGI